MNTWVVFLKRYAAGIVAGSEDKLEEIERERVMMMMELQPKN